MKFPTKRRLVRRKIASRFVFMRDLESKPRPLDVHKASIGAFNAGWSAAVEYFRERHENERRAAR